MCKLFNNRPTPYFRFILIVFNCYLLNKQTAIKYVYIFKFILSGDGKLKKVSTGLTAAENHSTLSEQNCFL